MAEATKKPGTHDLLAKLLRKRLSGDLDKAHLPFAVENRGFSGRSIHLLVVWDAFRGLASGERSQIITNAYGLAHPGGPTPAGAMGFTASEALSLGYLPFKIVALVRKTDGVSRTKLDAAMQKVGGVLVKVGDELELRFATRAQAANAYRDLVAELPSPVWTLIEERSAAETA